MTPHLDQARVEGLKLTAAQADALDWLYADGSWKRWTGPIVGHPTTSALMALVRRKLAQKRGGDGTPPYYRRTP